MRIIYKVKNVLGMSRPVGESQQQHADNLSTTTKSSSRSNSIHSVPPGEWPKEGPKPSKCAVLFYYMSIALTIIGTIIVIRSAFFIQEDEKPVALGIGLCLATGGIALIAITNVINKIEHDRILRYLEMKVEELRYHENFGKMPNHQDASYLVPAEETPPV